MSFGFVSLSSGLPITAVGSGTLNVDTTYGVVYWTDHDSIFRYAISGDYVWSFPRSNINFTLPAIFNPVDGFLYLTTLIGGNGWGLNKLSFADIQNNTSTAIINMQNYSDDQGNLLGTVQGLALSTDGTKLYVSTYNGSINRTAIALFNLPSLTFVKATEMIGGGIAPRLFGVDDFNGKLYGYNNGANYEIFSFDISTLLLTNTATLGPNVSRGIFDSVSNKVYVYLTNNPLTIYRLSGGTLAQETVQTFPTYSAPDSAYYNQALYGLTKNIYFSVRNLGTLAYGVAQINIPGLTLSNFIADGGTGGGTPSAPGDAVIYTPLLQMYVLRNSTDGNFRVAKYSIDSPPVVGKSYVHSNASLILTVLKKHISTIQRLAPYKRNVGDIK